MFAIFVLMGEKGLTFHHGAVSIRLWFSFVTSNVLLCVLFGGRELNFGGVRSGGRFCIG